MSNLRKISALLTRSALHRVIGTGIARLDIGGVRLLPFRAALGLLISSVRRSAVQKASPKAVRGQSEPSGQLRTKGGCRHG